MESVIIAQKYLRIRQTGLAALAKPAENGYHSVLWCITTHINVIKFAQLNAKNHVNSGDNRLWSKVDTNLFTSSKRWFDTPSI